MLTSSPSRRRRAIVWSGVVVGLAITFYFLPLFHLVPLQAAREELSTAAFDPENFVEDFWTTRLLPATGRAVDAGVLLSAFEEDAAGAADRFGFRLGVSGTACYLISGTGKIVGIDKGSVTIAVREGGAGEVIIETGPVFGNAIRDGSGLLDVSDFPNSRDFNAISAEINRRVEERVLPILEEKAAVGASISFVGCTEVPDSETRVSFVRVVPIRIEFP